jgi:ketosteroid isomerase-like protein
MQESHVELARQGFDAAMRGDFAAIEQLLDPDVKWHGGDPSAAGSCQNRRQALAWMQRGGIHGRPVGELVDAVDAGDKVVVIIRRMPGDGPPELVANLTSFRDGKVIEMVHYADPDEALAAAGVAARRG